MNTNKQGKTPIYDASFKIAVAREYLTGNLGYGALAKKYGLPGADNVKWFVKWYKNNEALTSSIPADKTLNTAVEATEKQLSLQLKEAHLKIAALEMLIQNAQKELGVDIIKKPGTKQSPK